MSRGVLFGGLRVGTRPFSKFLLSDSRAYGVVDRLEDYAREGQDLSRVGGAVRAFFEDPGSLVLDVTPSWAFWVLPFAWLWHAVAIVVGQLCLPIRPSRIRARVLALDPKVSKRVKPRAVIRSYEGSGRVMQAIVYAVYEHGERGYMSATFPLPFCAMEGILRLHVAGEGAVVLESTPADGIDRGHTGVYLHGFLGRVRTPFGETLALWDTTSPLCPPELRVDDPNVTLVGRHEQRFLGMLLVRHAYAFRPLSPGV